MWDRTKKVFGSILRPLSADIADRALNNIGEIEYSVTLYYGSNFQALKMNPDTGSQWMAIEGKLCGTCAPTTFDYDNASA